MIRLFGLLVALGALAGCGNGNTPLYYHVTAGQTSSETGTDCQGLGNNLNSYTGIDGAGTWVIYQGGTQLLLEGVLPNDLLVGTQTGSTYTFTGSITQANTVPDIGGNTIVTVTTKITITMTLSGPGFSGTVATEVGCTSGDGQSCGGDSNDGKDSDCQVTATTAGTQITNVQSEEGQEASTPSSPG